MDLTASPHSRLMHAEAATHGARSTMRDTMTSRKITTLLLTALLLATALGGPLTGCATLGQDKEKIAREKKAEWHYKMGAGYFQEHQVPLAIRELTLALEKNPKHLHAHYLMGFIYMGRRDYTKAIHHFKTILALEPKFFDARNSLGATYLAAERWQDAVEAIEPLLEEPLYTSQELAHNNLGWAYYNMRKYAKATHHFKMAVFLRPQFCLGYNNLGLAYRAQKRNAEAQTQFQKAIRLCPTNYADPHFELGKLLQESGDPAARKHFQRCADLQPYSKLGDRCRQYLGLL